MLPHFFYHRYLIAIIILTSCSQQQDKKGDSQELINFFSPIEISEGTTQPSTLKIEARFSECGEWGGHKENIIITADENKKFYAAYKIFPFNCDSLDFYYNNKNLPSIFNKTIHLNEATKKSIVDYIERMRNSKIDAGIVGHAGNIFSVISSDSTINIQVYNMNEFYVQSYKLLITELMK